MDCCQCQLIEAQFDRKTVEDKVRQYHEKGLKKETRILVEALISEGIEGYSILDIGGGLGALELVTSSVKKANRLYGLIYPRDT